MVLEIARLTVIPGQQQDFEYAFAKAEAIITAMSGYLSHHLKCCVEQDNEYVLLVYWETLEDHIQGFRQSPEYQQWRDLLHHFYVPAPEVKHYREVQVGSLPPTQDDNNLSVRLYQSGDFEQIWPLSHAVATYYAIGKVPSADETRRYVEEQVLGPNSDVRIALAIVDTKAVGIATFSIMYPSPETGAQLYLKELYVDAAYRNQGAGRALMQFVAGYGLERGCNRLDWSAEKTNPGALDFYHAIGAKPLTHKLYYRLQDDELKAFVSG